MGHHCSNNLWDMCEHSFFLLTSAWTRGIDVSPKVLHKYLLFYIWSTWARAWVGVEAKTSRPRYRGLSLQISLIYKVSFGSQTS